jgi:hypothetical protein
MIYFPAILVVPPPLFQQTSTTIKVCLIDDPSTDRITDPVPHRLALTGATGHGHAA